MPDTTMGDSRVILLCLGALLCLTSVSAAKSHKLVFEKFGDIFVNSSWFKNWKVEVIKVSKDVKLANMNSELMQAIDGNDIMCEVKVSESTDTKYRKSLADFPQKSCCDFMENITVGWPCVQSHSNFPKLCPIPKGSYWVKDFNISECNYPDMLPPNLAPKYKADILITDGLYSIAKIPVFAKLIKNLGGLG